MTNSGTIENTEAGVVAMDDPIENNGTLRASAGIFDIGGALSGTGSLLISGSGEMNLEGNADITQNVTFAAGATGTLEFQATATTTPTAIYDGVISGFGAADAIDLFGLSCVPGSSTVVSKVFSAGDTTLTVTNGTDTVALKFAGNLTGHTFVLGDDGSGKTRITDPVGKIASGATTTLVSTANDSPSLINLAAAGNVALLGELHGVDVCLRGGPRRHSHGGDIAEPDGADTPAGLMRMSPEGICALRAECRADPPAKATCIIH